MVKMKGDKSAVAKSGIGNHSFPADVCGDLCGSSPNLWNPGKTDPLMAAVAGELPSTYIRDLIRDGAGVNVQDIDGKTALMHAIAGRRELSLDILTQLIGDNVNVQDKNGYTPLMYAVSYGAEKGFIQKLLERGADLGMKDNFGRTVMSRAIQSCPYKHFSYINTVENASLQCIIEIVDLIYPYMSPELKVFVADYFINRSGLTFRKLCEENQELLRWMLHKCIVPKAIVPKEAFNESTGCDSPLISAVLLGHVVIARYLLDLDCLTAGDLAFLVGIHKRPKLRITLKMRSWAREVNSQPWSLQKLSQLVVSTAIGNGPERIQRVSELQIPTLLQESLSYKNKPYSIPQ